MELELFVTTTKHGAYDIQYKLRKKNFEQFIDYAQSVNKIKTKPEKNEYCFKYLLGSAGTRILKPKQSWISNTFGIFKSYDHIMVLDCDTPSSMIAACSYLKQNNIGFVVIMSSPEHYWVVTDVVGSLKTIIDLMYKIPGVDERYIKASRSQGLMLIRAIAHPHKVPKFDSINTLTNALSIAWYEAFKAHYNKPEIEKLRKTLALFSGIKDGSILKMASDPNFIV